MRQRDGACIVTAPCPFAAEEGEGSGEPPAFDGDDEDGSSSGGEEDDEDMGEADPVARARAVAAALRSDGAAGGKRASTFGTGEALAMIPWVASKLRTS